MGEECLICCEEYPSGKNHWRVLKCNHKLCIACHTALETKRKTMSGKEHVFLKCPLCSSCEGNQIGTCPTGKMTHKIKKDVHCEGYEEFSTICIDYIIEGKYKLNRRTYLPNTKEGATVLKLLYKAWDRRLLFSIGTSLTTGIEDTVVWNIHQKTNVTGGVAAHGFPDPTFISRILDDLKQLGIQPNLWQRLVETFR